MLVVNSAGDYNVDVLQKWADLFGLIAKEETDPAETIEWMTTLVEYFFGWIVLEEGDNPHYFSVVKRDTEKGVV